MSNTGDLRTLQETIEAIAEEDMRKPDIPVDADLQEGEDLARWAGNDTTKLTSVGLNSELITTLPVRVGACREAQSIWTEHYRKRDDAMKQWLERAPEGFRLRDEILVTFEFVSYGDDNLSSKVKMIAEGNSNADMIQDLNDLSVLGLKHTDKFLAIDYDLDIFDTAATLSDELATLLAAANGGRYEISDLRILRDKAYTYMFDAMREIRRCGQYVFRDNPERLKGYISRYRHLQNKRRYKKNKSDI